MAGRGFRGTARAGRRGEDVIAAAYRGWRTSRGADELCPRMRAADVAVPAGCLPFPSGLPANDNAAVEVKTDTYHPDDTPNMFMERWTVRPDGSRIPGGPWRAGADGVDALAYLYAATGLVVWVWGLEFFGAWLEDQLRDGAAWRRVRVTNPDGYAAIGRLVPRAAVLKGWPWSCAVVLAEAEGAREDGQQRAP